MNSRTDDAHLCEYRGRHDKDPSHILWGNGTVAAVTDAELAVVLLRERLAADG